MSTFSQSFSSHVDVTSSYSLFLRKFMNCISTKKKKEKKKKRNYSYVLSFSILTFQILSVECLVAIGWYDVCGWHWAVWCVRLTVMEINEPVWLSRPKKYRVLPKNMYGPATEGDLEKVFYMLGKFPACCVLRYEICMKWCRCFLPLLLDLTVKKKKKFMGD